MWKHIENFKNGFILGIAIVWGGATVGVLSLVLLGSLFLVFHRRGPWITLGVLLFSIPSLIGFYEVWQHRKD